MIHNLGEVEYSFNEESLIIYYIKDKIIILKIPLKELNLNIIIENKIEITPTNNDIINNSRIIDPNLPVVALTFDDGPSKYTEDIINILKDNDANATFFVLGNKVNDYKDVISKSIKNGNEIGNHSYNHKWLSRVSVNELLEQINMTQNILRNAVNYTPTHFRPTYGSINDQIRKNIDLDITLWTIDTKDWKIKNVDRIVEKAIKNVKDGDIILMHDIFKRSSDAVRKIVPKLKENGYQLITISELEEVKLIRSRY